MVAADFPASDSVVRAFASSAESVAGAAVPFAVSEPHWPAVARPVDVPAPAAVAASAGLSPAGYPAFAAAFDISDPFLDCPCWRRRTVQDAGSRWDAYTSDGRSRYAVAHGLGHVVKREALERVRSLVVLTEHVPGQWALYPALAGVLGRSHARHRPVSPRPLPHEKNLVLRSLLQADDRYLRRHAFPGWTALLAYVGSELRSQECAVRALLFLPQRLGARKFLHCRRYS